MARRLPFPRVSPTRKEEIRREFVRLVRGGDLFELSDYVRALERVPCEWHFVCGLLPFIEPNFAAAHVRFTAEGRQRFLD